MPIIVGLVLLTLHLAHAQSTNNIDITYSKTTSLVFPYPIINVDRGSKDVLAQKVNGAENTLQIKAARKLFPETNLTIVTADGKLHHFYVNYCDSPETQIFLFGDVIQFPSRMNMQRFMEFSKDIIRRGSGKIRVSDNRYKMKLAVKGLFILDDVILCQLEVKNRSNINYDIQSLRFFIHDKQKVKRTSWQENEVIPLYTYNKTAQVKGKTKINIVIGMEKFTIPDARVLDVELLEHRGGRNLKVRIKNSDIVRAEKLVE